MILLQILFTNGKFNTLNMQEEDSSCFCQEPVTEGDGHPHFPIESTDCVGSIQHLLALKAPFVVNVSGTVCFTKYVDLIRTQSSKIRADNSYFWTLPILQQKRKQNPPLPNIFLCTNLVNVMSPGRKAPHFHQIGALTTTMVVHEFPNFFLMNQKLICWFVGVIKKRKSSPVAI